jgi:hypothetical protein
MKKLGLFMIIAAILISLSASDGYAFQLGGKEMVKSGAGVRTRFILGTLYHLTLWLPASLKGKSDKEIIEANQPMSFVLVLESKLVTRERFVETTAEGFNKAASSGYTSAKKQAFLDQFNKVKFEKGDIVNMSYTPAGLTTSYKYVKTGKTEVLGVIPGLDLKKALFAIWLGSNPAQESLKKDLLGGK